MTTITIRKGASFLWTLRPETAIQRYAQINSITMTDNGVRLGASSHGLVEGWRFRVSRCKGLTRLNTLDEDRPRAADWFQAVVVDADTVEINTVNVLGDKPYTGGGILQYGVPLDLTGCVVRAQIRPNETSSTVLLDLEGHITVDAANYRIDFDVPGTETSAISVTQGVLGVEIEDTAPVPLIMSLPAIPVTFKTEIVRDE